MTSILPVEINLETKNSKHNKLEKPHKKLDLKRKELE